MIDTTVRAAGWREGLALDILAALADPSATREATIRAILVLIQRATGLAQVGLRLRDGEDFPFYAYHGYSEDFLRDENSLLARGPDGLVCVDERGQPRLSCLCGRVLEGQVDPEDASFTPRGSFLTPSWSGLAPRAAELGVTRGRCLAIGSETHALVPLRQSGGTVGLLHLADPLPHRLDREEVVFLESLGASIAVALGHQQAEAARREVESTYRGVLENLGFGYALHEMLFDEAGRARDYVTLEVNGAFERIMGVSREAVVGLPASAILPADELSLWVQRFSRAITLQQAHIYEAYSPKNDKHFRGCAFAPEPGRFEASGARPGRACFAVCFEDVSERKRASAELAASRAELRLLSHAQQDAIEEERARLARALHDELGAGLVGMKLDARWLEDHLPEEADAELRRCARSLAESADALAALSRRIVTDLRPPILDHMGLPAAIEWLARGIERRAGIRCELTLPSELPLERDAATALFRAAQEALTNVTRHAGASTVSVRLVAEAGRVQLEVRDNGRGLGATPPGDALGLTGMRERIEHRGGSLVVESAPGQGTRLVIELPLSR